MSVEVYIEGQRVTLFKDEEITITQGVQNVKDISKIFADFSQSFTVPADNNNNIIFKHYFDSDIDGGYDARTRKDAYISVGSLDFKVGKMRLDNVKKENNVPVHYNITFFGSIIKIKDLLGDDKLFDLDWLDNLDHDYSGAVVKTGLTTGIDFTIDTVDYDKAIIYPLISYQRQYLYNSNPSDTTSTDTLVNIGYDAGRSDGVDNGELKPAIQLYMFIVAIQEQYGLSFNSPFFDSQIFRQIYVNLNNSVDANNYGIKVVEDLIDQPISEDLGLFYRYEMQVTPAVGFESIPYKMRLSVNDSVVYETNNFLTGTKTRDGQLEIQGSPDLYSIKAEVITNLDFDFDANTKIQYLELADFTGLVTLQTNSYTGLSIDLLTIIKQNLPDIKVYDFLTSIFKMFNLVAVPDGEDILIQDLQSWYSEGQIYDITPFVNTKSEKIERGNILKQIDFKFEESDQILADEFEQSNNQRYGNLEFQLTDENGTPLQDVDGGTLEIESIFENPIFERLFDLDNSDQTVVQYCLYTNREVQPISGKPFMFYAPSVSVSSNPIGFVNDGVYEEINTTVLMPSHSLEIDNNSFNLNFNAVINEYTSSVFEDTIYNRYYDDYITDIFSIKRRLYKYDALLPDSFLNKLKLNDRIIIKDKRYLINSISSKLTNRGDSLELINDIYEAPLATDILNTSVFRSPGNSFGANNVKFSTTYVGIGDQLIRLLYVVGTGWATLNTVKSNGSATDKTITEVDFELSANNSGLERTAYIEVFDGINNPRYIIIQKA